MTSPDPSKPSRPEPPPGASEIRVPTIEVAERRTTIHLGWTAAALVAVGLTVWGARTFYERSKESMEVPEHARVGQDLALANEMARAVRDTPIPSPVGADGRPVMDYPGKPPPPRPGGRTLAPETDLCETRCLTMDAGCIDALERAGAAPSGPGDARRCEEACRDVTSADHACAR